MQKEFPEFSFVFQDQKTDDKWKGVGMRIDPNKLSFNYVVPTNIDNERVGLFLQSLQRFFSDFTVILSQNLALSNNSQTAWFCDIVPFGKDEVIRYLSQKYKAKGLIAGDSGNDINMLFGDFPGEAKDYIRTAVGGSQQELLKEINKFSSSPRDWRLLIIQDKQVRMYVETKSSKSSNRIGPQTLEHVIDVLERAWRIFGKK
ncbi:MAG: HAD family hydrolase [Patescibacteria group bacterium]|nr:HAD family hydrolase [Patescibacteria group bacterium]